MRVAYQLGKGWPGMTKLAGYRAMLIVLVVAIWVSAIFLSLEQYPAIVANEGCDDPTHVARLVSVVGIEQRLTVGIILWSVVGGQG